MGISGNKPPASGPRRLDDSDIDAHFWQWVDDSRRAIVDSLNESQGLVFVCPHPGHTHRIACWFRNPPWLAPAPETAKPVTRFTVSGTGLGDLTITEPVIDAHEHDDCGLECWRGSIVNGTIVDAE